MSDDEKNESERIAELEREVADLRERLGQQQGAGAGAQQQAAAGQGEGGGAGRGVAPSAKAPDEYEAQEEAFFEGGEGGAGEGGADEAGEPLHEPGGPADPRDQRELEGHLPSRRRAVIIGVCVGAVALAAIVAIVLSLSQVITPLSKSAAGALEPFEAPAKQRAPAEEPEHPPVKAAPSPVRAPGL
jgi:hypothetical protein